ncbi:MAG: bifunctional demethylmenaquinone methyltransferase/2-methoxy-6-polyprenyl-1,4-benzoquinol methylase UbiE [Planctomycetota bacterium]|jgi:demethylmenaquinone methyltransferase/2-methoxy-6-polyprenyl-1,4-benzoquinol methylase
MMTPRAPFSSQVVWPATDLAAGPHRAADKDHRVQRMFAGIAHSYDLNNRIHSLWRDQSWRRRAVAMCRVRPTDHVLDAACGTGDLAEAFAAAGPARVCGVDFTAEMLRQARRKAWRRRRTNWRAAPEYLLGDIMALPFADASFDIVSIAFGIRNVSDPPRALGEFRRVMRAGGRLIILEFSQPANPLLRLVNDLYCGHIMPLTATLLAGDRTGAYRYLPRSVATFADRRQLVSMVKDAGFAEITQYPMTFGVCVAYLGHVVE